MTSIVFKTNQENYSLPVFSHVTYNKVIVELNGGSGGGGPQKGGPGAKLKGTVPDLTGKTLKITLGAAVTPENDGGNASYLLDNAARKYLMVAGGGGGWGGGDGLASVVLLKPILKFGTAYTVTVNGDGQGAQVLYTDSIDLVIEAPGQGFTEIPTVTLRATDTGETILLENGINATIRLNAVKNAIGGAAGGLLGAGGVGGGQSGGKGGSLGVVATKSESGVGGMGGTKNNTMVGKSGASITQPVSTIISEMLGGKKTGNTTGVGHGGLGETEGGCGGGGWGGGGGGGNYCGGGGGGSMGPIGTVFSSSYEEPFVRFTYLPGLTLENRQTDIGILKVCQENYSDTIKYTTQFVGNELTILAARDGLLTTSKFTLTEYYSKVQILDTLSTTLTTAIVRSLTLPLTSTTGILNTSGFLLLNNEEQIKYTGTGTGNTLTGISRGYNGTTAQAHAGTVSVLQITFLKDAITNVVLRCTLLTPLPGLEVTGYILIGSEQITYTQISTDRLILYGLVRGYNGTTPASHTINEPVKPFTVLTTDATVGDTSITVESIRNPTGRILIGTQIIAYTGITGINALTLTGALTADYTVPEPVYYFYTLNAALTIPTFDLNTKKDADTVLIKTETIRYEKNTVLTMLSNDPPPSIEYVTGEKVLYAGKMVRDFLIGLPRATVGGPFQDIRIPVVNGQPITALGTRYYTLPTGVKKIKIIAIGGSGGGGVLGGLAAKVEYVTLLEVTKNLLVGVGAEGPTDLNGLNGGGEASIVANTASGEIHVLAGGGGGAYGTSKVSTQDATTKYTNLGTYINEYTYTDDATDEVTSYAGEVTYDAGGGGGGNGTASIGLPGGGGKSFPTKGIPAVNRGNGSVTLFYIEPLVIVRRQGGLLEMRQPVGLDLDLDLYYSLKTDGRTVIARSKEGQETETLLPTGITHVRINGQTLTNAILSGQRISTHGVEKEYTINPAFKQVKIVLSGACGGSFSSDKDGGGEGAELSGYMSLPGTITVLTGLAGKFTQGGSGSYIKNAATDAVLLVAGGGGGSSNVHPLLIADTNNKRVLLINDFLTADRRAITDRLSLPISVAYDALWNIYVLDQGYNRIAKYGGGTDLAFQYYLPDLDLKQPTGFVIDNQGTFYIADQKRLVSRTNQGVIRTIPLDFTPSGLCFSPTDIYLSDADKNRVVKVDKTTFVLTTLSGLPTLNGPTGLAFRDENLYICDTGNNRVILNGSVLPALLLKAPQSVYVSESHIYIADTGNDRIVRIDRLAFSDGIAIAIAIAILGSSGTGALQFRNPLCITGPFDYKSGIGYPGGQMKISSTSLDLDYQIASLGNTDWQTVTETTEESQVQDTVTVKVVPQRRLGEGSVINIPVEYVANAENGENGENGTNGGGDGGVIVNPNALAVKLAVPRDHGGLTITFLPILIVLPATDPKIQPLRQDHTDSNIKYTFLSSSVILAFTPEGLRTETDVSDFPGVTHFVIQLPNKSKYILLVR